MKQQQQQLMQSGGGGGRNPAGIYKVQSITTPSGKQPLRRQPQKVHHFLNESLGRVGERTTTTTLAQRLAAAKETASYCSRPSFSSFLPDDDTNSKKKRRRGRRGVAIVSKLSAAARELRNRWRLLSFCSRAAVLVVGIPLFTLHVFFGTIDLLFHSYGPLQPPQQQQQPLLPPYNGNETSFAVVINTYKRPDMLKAAVQHYANTCGRSFGVEQVFVVWAELDVTPPEPTALFFTSPSSSSRLRLRKIPTLDSSNLNNQPAAAAAHVEIIRVAADSLNSRFLPIVNLTSRAIFMVDDDVLVDCFSLHQGFLAWKSSPDSMVGYYPRLAAIAAADAALLSSSSSKTTDHNNDEASSSDYSYVYHSWPMVYWRHEMNFVLTKAAFLHSRYLDLYSSDETHPREIKEYVDKHRNCEDVAMSMLIANVTAMEYSSRAQEQQQGESNHYNNEKKLPAMPIYVQGRVSDYGLFHGISTGTGHFPQRSNCLNDLTRIYRQHHGWDNASPLDYRVPLRQTSWVRPAPGFWWQYRPSNIFEWFAIQNIFQ